MVQSGLNSKTIALDSFITSERESVLCSAHPFKWMYKDKVNFIKTVEIG